MRIRHALPLLLVLCTIASAREAGSSAVQDYAVTDLGRLGDWNCFPCGINNSGDVVGYSEGTDGSTHAFLWRDGVITDLGTGVSQAYGINDSGRIVGLMQAAAGDIHGFIWNKGQVTDLGTLGGDFSYTNAINGRGWVVGGAAVRNGPWSLAHAFLWRRGPMLDLGTLGGPVSFATAINDDGDVVGSAAVSTWNSHAFLWRKGTVADLGTLGGLQSGAGGVNNRGWAVGFADTPDGSRHACLWRDGEVLDLGTLGGRNSWATGLNDRGQVVGCSESPRGLSAFIWQGGVMTDLNDCISQDCGFGLMTAVAISNSGRIACRASGSSRTIGVLLDPIRVSGE